MPPDPNKRRKQEKRGQKKNAMPWPPFSNTLKMKPLIVHTCLLSLENRVYYHVNVKNGKENKRSLNISVSKRQKGVGFTDFFLPIVWEVERGEQKKRYWNGWLTSGRSSGPTSALNLKPIKTYSELTLCLERDQNTETTRILHDFPKISFFALCSSYFSIPWGFFFFFEIFN